MDFVKLKNLSGINVGFKQLQQSGQIVYEYNPLKVMRSSNSEYKNEITDLDTEKLNFDVICGEKDYTTRVIDLISPQGKGQRGSSAGRKAVF